MLALALFRFVNPTASSITLDGIGMIPPCPVRMASSSPEIFYRCHHDCLVRGCANSSTQVAALSGQRSRLALILQDAVLFGGTIRDNLVCHIPAILNRHLAKPLMSGPVQQVYRRRVYRGSQPSAPTHCGIFPASFQGCYQCRAQQS